MENALIAATVECQPACAKQGERPLGWRNEHRVGESCGPCREEESTASAEAGGEHTVDELSQWQKQNAPITLAPSQTCFRWLVVWSCMLVCQRARHAPYSSNSSRKTTTSEPPNTIKKETDPPSPQLKHMWRDTYSSVCVREQCCASHISTRPRAVPTHKWVPCTHTTNKTGSTHTTSCACVMPMQGTTFNT